MSVILFLYNRQQRGFNDMQALLSKFNTRVNLEEIRKDLVEINNHQVKKSEFEEIPEGVYEVKVEKMEIRESKKGDPMFSVWFRVIEGKYKNGLIFFNKLLTQSFLISQCNQMMQSFRTGTQIEFQDYVQYNQVIEEVFERMTTNRLEYAINYVKDKNGYTCIEVTDVFVA